MLCETENSAVVDVNDDAMRDAPGGRRSCAGTQRDAFPCVGGVDLCRLVSWERDVRCDVLPLDVASAEASAFTTRYVFCLGSGEVVGSVR